MNKYINKSVWSVVFNVYCFQDVFVFCLVNIKENILGRSNPSSFRRNIMHEKLGTWILKLFTSNENS